MSYAEVYGIMNMLYGTSPIEIVTTRPVLIKPYHHIAVCTYRNGKFAYEIQLRYVVL